MPAPKQEREGELSVQQLNQQAIDQSHTAFDQTVHDLRLWEALPQVQPLERQELARAAQENKRDDFIAQLSRLAPSLDRSKIIEIYNNVSLAFQQNLGHLLNGQANEAAKEGNKTARDYWLQLSGENGHLREQLGETGAQAANLLEIGQGLNKQQQEDLLRAALEVGFSYAAVRSTANNLGVAMPGKTEEAVQGMLENAAMELAQDIMQRMRELLDSYSRDGNPEAMREYEREVRRLSYLLGEGPARRIEALTGEQKGETDETVRQAIAAQIELARRLHSGEENGVMPTKEAAPRVDTRRRSA